MVRVRVLVLVLVKQRPLGSRGRLYLKPHWQGRHLSQKVHLPLMQQPEEQREVPGVLALALQVSPTRRQPPGVMGLLVSMHQRQVAELVLGLGAQASQKVHLPFRQHEESQPPHGRCVVLTHLAPRGSIALG